MNFPDLNLQDTSLLMRKCKRLGKRNRSFWFHSASIFFFPGDYKCEKQDLFTCSSEIIQGYSTALIHS